MENINSKQLIKSMRTAQEQIAKLSATQRTELEKRLDIEHAYYSSALEGSKLDRKEFEELGKNIN